MAVITLHASGPAPVDLVWARYAEPARWAQWAPQIRAVDTDAVRIAPGVTGRVVGPFGVRVRFVVRSVEEERRRWTWSVSTGPVRVHLEHEVTRRGAGSSTSLRLRGPAPVVVAYAPVARLALGSLVA